MGARREEMAGPRSLFTAPREVQAASLTFTSESEQCWRDQRSTLVKRQGEFHLYEDRSHFFQERQNCPRREDSVEVSIDEGIDQCLHGESP